MENHRLATVASVYENWKVKNSHFQHLKLNYFVFDGCGYRVVAPSLFSTTIRTWIQMRLGQTQSPRRQKYMVPSLMIKLITRNQTWPFGPSPRPFSAPSGSKDPRESVGVRGTNSTGEQSAPSLRSSANEKHLAPCHHFGGEKSTGSRLNWHLQPQLWLAPTMEHISFWGSFPYYSADGQRLKTSNKKKLKQYISISRWQNFVCMSIWP